VVHSKKSLFQQNFQQKLYHFNRNSQIKSVIKKIIRWTCGVGQKIRLVLPALLGIRLRLHAKTSDSFQLRNPASKYTDS